MKKRVKLIAARARKNWTLNQAAEQLGCAANTLNRWELGMLNPSAYSRQRLCIVYEAALSALGLETEVAVVVEEETNPVHTYISSNLTMHLLSLILSTEHTPIEVQQEVERVLEGFSSKNVSREAEQRRHDVLQIIAMYPLAHKNASFSADVSLNLYAAGIITCGHLSNGGYEDRQLASTMITTYLPALHSILNSSSHYRKAAAGLIAQALQMKSRSEDVEQAIRDKEEAVYYARESGNRILLITALRTLTAHYEYGIANHPERVERALQYVQEAQSLMEQKQGPAVPTLIQSWVYTGLAKYLAFLGLEQEMATFLRKAEETFFASSDIVKEPGNISYNRAYLIRHKAMAYAYLGRQDQAFKIFGEELIDIDDHFVSRLPIPARNRLGILSEFTFTTLYLPQALKDKELSIALWKANIEETKELRSESYFDEARLAYAVMKGIWSDDADVRALRDLLVHW